MVEKVCKYCGSEGIVADAWAVWDTTTQQWVLSNVFDFKFCRNCDGETTVIDKPITTKQNL